MPKYFFKGGSPSRCHVCINLGSNSPWSSLLLKKAVKVTSTILERMKTCKLGSSQTQRVLDLLDQGELYLQTKVEKISASTNSHLLPLNKVLA